MRVLKTWATSGPAGSAWTSTSVPSGLVALRTTLSGGRAQRARASSNSGKPVPVLAEMQTIGTSAPLAMAWIISCDRLLGRRRRPFKIPLHDRLVGDDDRLDQRLADFLGVEQGAGGVGRRIERAGHAVEIRPVPQRHVQRHTGRAEQFLDPLEQPGEVDVVGVHAVDDDHPAQAGLARLGEDPAGVDLDPRLGIDDDHRGIDAPQGPNRLADEVGIARRVDGVEPFAGMVEVGHLGLDRVAVRLLFLVEVADARAVVHAGRAGDRSRLRQDAVHQRRLAARFMATESDVADVFDLVHGSEQ